ncbi:MAG: AGE family epimerase/isomerase [Burkholderiales bacterium]|nr:AGE family epimerase/isomerase [Burkholderiales bacterium]
MHDALASPVFPATLEPGALRGWLVDHVCRFWADRVVDAKGGFFESLDAQGAAVKSPRRTLLAQGRLTYVFSHAAVLDASGRMRAVADHGFQELCRWEHASRTVGGWARARLAEGGVDDPTRDTYDQTFVILACAWYYAATKNPAALEMAERAYTFLSSHVADDVHGGFFEEFPNVEALPRRQNPHMHLLEACLAMRNATGGASWLGRSDELVGLFGRHLFDHASGSVAEFFCADWTPAPGAPGLLREPGHQFEWVWLLAEYRRLGGRREVGAWIDRLFAFGQAYGLDTQGPRVVLDGVSPQGQIVADTKLFWPQTEYIKACVARAQAGDAHAGDEAGAHFRRLQEHFFHADGANWCNQLCRDGTFLSGATPARVLYHLFLAVAELARCGDSPARPGRTS